MQKRKLPVLLMPLLLLASCATSNPPLTVPAPVIPAPEATLMIPPLPSPVNVPEALSFWTNTLQAWQAKREACRLMPAKSVDQSNAHC